MQRKIGFKSQENQENNLVNLMWEKPPDIEANNSQRSTDQNSSINNSKENIVVEPNDSKVKRDFILVKMVKMNIENDDYVKDFDKKKDINEIKNEQYIAMECESDNEKEVKEEKCCDKIINTPASKELNETPLYKEKIIKRKNNEIINQGKKFEKIEGNSHIKLVKRKPLFKNKRYKRKKGKTELNNNISNYMNTGGELSIPETTETLDDFDQRLHSSEIEVESINPHFNRGDSESLFDNIDSDYHRNIAFYNDMNIFCNGETNFKTKFK